MVNFCVAVIEEWRNLGQRFIDRSINSGANAYKKSLRSKGDTLNMFSD